MSESESDDYRSDSSSSSSSEDDSGSETEVIPETDYEIVRKKYEAVSEPTDAMINEVISQLTPKQMYNLALHNPTNLPQFQEKRGKSKTKKHHKHSRSRSRSPSDRKRKNKKSKDKDGLDEPKGKRSSSSRRSKKSKDSGDVPPPSRMTKAELQIALKEAKQELNKYMKKLEKGQGAKKERKSKDIDEEEIKIKKEVVEEQEPKPLGNDIMGRPIQGEPIEPQYL